MTDRKFTLRMAQPSPRAPTPEPDVTGMMVIEIYRADPAAPGAPAKLITCYLSQTHGPVRTHYSRDVGRGDERRGYDCTLIPPGDVDWIIDRLNKRTGEPGKAFLAMPYNPSPDVEPRTHVIIGAASATESARA